MDRRVFVGSLAGALLARPFRAAAQGVSGVPRIGLLRPGTPSDVADRASVGAFLNGLQEAGYTPGADVRVEIRYAEGKLERLKAIARDLVALPAHVLVTSNPYATEAARDATHTVPIVVALDYETDPVARGWIASIARPQGNLTGLFLDQPEMTGKLLALLKEAVPDATLVAVLWDETIGRSQLETTQDAARVKGLGLRSLGVRRSEDLAEAFGAAARERADCLIVLTSPLLSLQRARISDLALRQRLPAITLFTNFPAFGLLMAYGPNQPDAFRRAASQYVARILKGSRPADLPVQRPEKFDLVVNLKTAKALGLALPRSLLLRADQVIQ
ncbi:MAG TPA: ABC transporter substrate-binding protein [Methylomirabilota bacterium]